MVSAYDQKHQFCQCKAIGHTICRPSKGHVRRYRQGSLRSYIRLHTPYSENSLFLISIKQYYHTIKQVFYTFITGQIVIVLLYLLKPSKNLPPPTQIPSDVVSNTAKHTPPNFLKNSLNRLCIEQGVRLHRALKREIQGCIGPFEGLQKAIKDP